MTDLIGLMMQDSQVIFIFVFIGLVASLMFYYIIGIFRTLRTPFYAGNLVERPMRIIDGKSYVLLQNIVRRPTSNMEPRPEKIISSYENRGWEIKICEDAQDIYGNSLTHCRSLWGRKTS